MTQRNHDATATDKGIRVDAIAEWRSHLAAIAGVFLLFETLTGLAIFALPFSEANQFGVLLHTFAGIAFLPAVGYYLYRHWQVRRRGNLSHFQVLGYTAFFLLAACIASGFVLTWQGAFATRMSHGWSLVHLISGLAQALFTVVHVVTVVVKKVNAAEVRLELVAARRVFYVRSVAGTAILAGLCFVWAGLYEGPAARQAFPTDYNWRFGEDRPFAPSMARLAQDDWQDQLDERLRGLLGADAEVVLASRTDNPTGALTRIREAAEAHGIDGDRRAGLEELLLASAARDLHERGAIRPAALAGSARCGTAGCHADIYAEWLPSAHRYSSLDDMFQSVQTMMAKETSPEQTRYCAGCHDPISLFSGAKNAGNITLSADGANEGASCLACHSIVQADVQGNGDYTIELPVRYAYEQSEGKLSEFLADFLIRTYPKHHVSSYSRPLYKTEEFCAACHKQYLDKEVNTDIGKVQGQNQYDSWKNSRWYHEGDPTKTVSCRECHMPLVESTDPAKGDVTDYNRTLADNKHRSHRTLASNQYIPVLQELEGGVEHAALTEQWLRGEYPIPEIADKWTDGPVVRIALDAPERVAPGERVKLQVVLTNNKTGHDFPTGPLDMIESWIELQVTDSAGQPVHQVGHIDAAGNVVAPPVSYRADGFDREGELIDRHNLWDMVGASYKRAMYPGVTDTVEVKFQCPSMARGRVATGSRRAERREGFAFAAPEGGEELTVEAVLWYRKANPEFLKQVYGADSGMESPATAMTRTTTTIAVRPRERASLE